MYSITATILVNKILYTSHACAHGTHTAAKCVMLTVVTRNDILLLITLFLCLHARDSLSVNGCNESSNRENCGVARLTTRARAGCPGDFFCKPGNIFENRVMVRDFIRPCMYPITRFLTRGIHYFYSFVLDCIMHSITVPTPNDKILHTSHARVHDACTVIKISC